MNLYKKRAARLMGAALFSALLVGCGDNPKNKTASAASGLEVELPITAPDAGGRSYDTIRMGRIAQGDIIEGSFRVKNVTDQPLVITQVITGCGCTTSSYDPKPIAPRQEREIKYQFDSRGLFGVQFKSIEVVTADSQCATVYLAGDVFLPDGK